MKVCTFCSNEFPMVFSHMTNDIGNLCLECYLKLQGSCGVCSTSLIPKEVKPNITYNLQGKFINMGDKKTILVCDPCHAAIYNEFPQLLG